MKKFGLRLLSLNGVNMVKKRFVVDQNISVVERVVRCKITVMLGRKPVWSISVVWLEISC